MLQTQIRNSRLIEKINTETGEVVAKALRGDTESAWYVGALIDGRMIIILQVFPHITEVKQRKLVLDLLDRLPFSVF